MNRVETRLAELGLVLPQANPPVANYVPTVLAGDLLYISGQVSSGPDGGIKGVVGDGLGLEQGQAAARLCGLNLLAQIRRAVDGDFSRVRRIVKLGGFVQAGPAFFDIPQVVSGCSDLMTSSTRSRRVAASAAARAGRPRTWRWRTRRARWPASCPST